MSDLISRQAAMNIFAVDLAEKDRQVSYQGFCIDAVMAIDSLPSAEKTGRWIWNPQNMTYICSCCGAVYNMGDDADAAVDWPDEAHYCMTCGARMEEKSIEHI